MRRPEKDEKVRVARPVVLAPVEPFSFDAKCGMFATVETIVNLLVIDDEKVKANLPKIFGLRTVTAYFNEGTASGNLNFLFEGGSHNFPIAGETFATAEEHKARLAAKLRELANKVEGIKL